MTQQKLFKNSEKCYGGELLKTRKGRSQGRPLSTTSSLHLVLRSSKAKKDWSFLRPKNKRIINQVMMKFSKKYGVKILDLSNVGNHLHLQIKLSNRYTYSKWIRAVTSAIAMKITGMNRWNGGKNDSSDRFWDYRPFTRVIQGFKALLTLKDYLLINKFEGVGIKRMQARQLLTFSNSRRTSFEASQ